MKAARYVSSLFFTAALVVAASSSSRAQTGKSWSLGTGAYTRAEFAELTPWLDGNSWSKDGKAKPLTQVSRKDFVNALTEQIPILGFARDWRNTFRGQGQTATRSFKLMEGGDDDLMLLIGSQQLPAFQLAGLGGGNTVGLGLKWGKISFGTTSVKRTFDNIASKYDSMTNDNTQYRKSTDESTMTWLVAKAMQNKNGSVDVLFVRASKDTTPWQSANKNIVSGTSMGMRGDYKLWSDWKMRGEWMNNRLEDGDQTQAWKIDADGSIQHPLGKLRFAVFMDERDPGYAAIGDMWKSEGFANQRLSLAQDLKFDELSMALRLDMSQNQKLSPDLRNGQETGRDSTQATADVRWKLSPTVSVTAKYAAKDEEQSLKTLLENDAVNDTTSQSAEAGLEWKLSQSLALTATAAQINTDRDFTPADVNAETRAMSRLQDKRLALGLSRRTRIGSWNIQMAQHFVQDGIGNSTNSQGNSLRIEAERQLMANLRLKGMLNLTNDDDLARSLSNERANQSIEAQWNISKRSRLDLRYSNWDSEDVGVNKYYHTDGDEFGLRFNYGASASGNGLGLSVEYSQRDTTNPDDRQRYKVGVTYK